MLTPSGHWCALSELIVVVDIILLVHDRQTGFKLPQSGGQLCDNCLATDEEIKQDKVGK